MRVGRARQRFGRASDERGAVAVVVAICLVLMFGMAAFALDTGNLWQKRRGLIQATDSAALAAAAAYGNPQDPNYLDACDTVAPDYVTKNDANATMTSCENHSLGDGSGYVTVDANTPVHFTFAPVFGINDRTVASTTTAAYGKPKGVNGLRPVGLCADNPLYADWIASDLTEPLTVSIPITDQGTTPPCGDALTNGNWSFLVLDGTADSGNTNTQNWFLNGCSCLVSVGDLLHGTPGGQGNSLAPYLNPILGQQIDVPVYGTVENCGLQNGGGYNCQYRVIGFVGIIINSYSFIGNPANRYINVTFVTHITTGTCCASGSTDTGERVVFMCAVDATFDPSNCQQS